MQTTPRAPLTGGTRAVATTPRRREISLWLLVSLTVFALDQATKAWAEHALSDGQPRAVVGNLLQLRLVHNPGAAFSTGTGYTVILTVIALVCAALAWGAFHHVLVRPALARAPDGFVARVGRSLLGEALVGVAVLLAAAVLVDSSPPPRPAKAPVVQAVRR